MKIRPVAAELFHEGGQTAGRTEGDEHHVASSRISQLLKRA